MSENENEEKEDENENDNEKNINNNLNKNKGMNIMAKFPLNEGKKSISQILSEVNFEMNSLSNNIDKQLIYSKYKTFHNNNVENLFTKEDDSNKIINNENLREISLI